MTYTEEYLSEAAQIIDKLDVGAIESIVQRLVELRARGGRLFLLGVGGGAGHATHAVADFRKIAGLEAYSPSDNVADLTARINDDGWDTAYASWLAGSRLQADDLLMIFSVGGGDAQRGISVNLVKAIDYARQVGAKIVGIVGRDGGHTAEAADACVIVPNVNPQHVTAHTESFQALVWHLLVSHPDLQTGAMKWESVQEQPKG